MSYQNDSRELLQFYKEKYDAVKQGKDDYVEKCDYTLGTLLYEETKIIDKINSILCDRASHIWILWWQKVLLEYTLRKFKIKKSVYHSPKASSFYSYCLKNKRYKQKAGKLEDVNKNMVIAYLEKFKENDATKSFYGKVIDDLKKQ